MIANTPIDILRFIVDRHAEAIDTVLVTLIGIEGASSRAIGAQMAVAADGRRLGSFSGGCVEDAVAAEALEALDDGWGRVVRYGIGSAYIDIRLPCGGGIDLLFTPRPDAATMMSALRQLDQRRATGLALGCDGVALLPDAVSRSWDGDSLHHAYQPALRIVALGQGEDLTAFARLGAAFGAQVQALTPDLPMRDLLVDEGIEATFLPTRNTLPIAHGDPWTAIVFLFHGRDWEEFLLPQAFALQSFYIGAIGSRKTHAARRAMLSHSGVSMEQIETLRGHIGLIPATRDPATLAVSILGEIVADYNALAHWSHWMGQPLETTASA